MRLLLELATYSAGLVAAIVVATTRSPAWTVVAFIVGFGIGVTVGVGWRRARS